MRVMIELDLPDGQDIPRAEDIKRLTDPNWISDWWNTDDCLGFLETNDLSEEECREVLRRANCNLDRNCGINWETIEYLVYAVASERINL